MTKKPTLSEAERKRSGVLKAPPPKPLNYYVMERAVELAHQLWYDEPQWTVPGDSLIRAWAEDYPNVTFEVIEEALLAAFEESPDPSFLPRLSIIMNKLPARKR